MTVSDLKTLLSEAAALARVGVTTPRLRMAQRAGKDALRHAVIGQDVEQLTGALLAKAQAMARAGQIKDYAAARRQLAVARASLWTPAQTTDAVESAARALAAALAELGDKRTRAKPAPAGQH